ncbi:MAG TPA: FtsX-like permease family protein, partial [Puia sp.]|nr:FtsX-like permease family protein [Puia sp.]
STSRMKEIGIRKVLGGLRRQLRIQFLTEAILLAMASTVVALLLYVLLFPLAGDMLGRGLPSLSALPVAAWGLILLFALFTGWLAGLYPATLLSSLASVDALKARVGTVEEKTLLRKGLVGFQFGTAAVAFIGVIIVSRQIRLFFSDRLGYNKDYMVSTPLPRDWSAQGVGRMEGIRNIFAAMPGVKDVALSYEIPNGMNGGGFGAYRAGGDSSSPVIADALVTDANYAATYQIPLAAGVFFHLPGEDDSRDSTRLVLNETASKALGWRSPREAIGQPLRLVGIPGKVFTVSGVVRDFHFGGMNRPINPVIFGPVSLFITYRYLSFKLEPGNIGSAIAALQRQWVRLMPGSPFEYKFMDESLEALYTNERRLQKAASTAAALMAVIVLLGVIGLVSGSLRRRTKEMAIRKVVGASVPGIIRLFIREYLPVLLVAGGTASPLAWWIMHRWLDEYATRITITVWPFVTAIVCLAVVIVVLIIAQTLHAARANPIDALRSE